MLLLDQAMGISVRDYYFRAIGTLALKFILELREDDPERKIWQLVHENYTIIAEYEGLKSKKGVSAVKKKEVRKAYDDMMVSIGLLMVGGQGRKTVNGSC